MYEETTIEEVETLQTELEIYSELTSEPIDYIETEVIDTGLEQEEITETTLFDDSQNLQRIAKNTDFFVGFCQVAIVVFVMFMLYKFLNIFF